MLNKDIVSQLTNCKVLSTVRQEDDEATWKAVRKKGIGGSDVGAICGVSPFTSARQIYLRKTGQYPAEAENTTASQERMHFGHLLEPVVADEFATREFIDDKAGFSLVDIDCTLQHKDNPWALANVDRLILDADGKVWGILECKTTSAYMEEEWASGNLLESYLYQLNWYMWVLGIERGYFACLVGGNKFYSYPVFRNDELLNTEIIPKAKSFWFDNVLSLKEPELQSVDTEFVNTIYADVKKNSEVFLSDDISNQLAATVFECKAKIKELEATMEAAQNGLKDRLKDCEIGYCQDYTVKWSPRTQKRIDSEKLKKDFPDVYLECLKTISFRAMSVKGG